MPDGKRELILDLLARNKMRGDTDAAARDLDKLGHAAESADGKTVGLGKSSEEAGQKVDKLGHSLEGTKGRISSLDKEIGTTKKDLASLSAAFADAGSASERIDISKAIRRTQKDLRDLTKNKGVLDDLLPDSGGLEKKGMRIGSDLAKSIRDGLTIGRGYVMGSVVALGLALAPQLGAAIAGAVVGGVGAGGLIGGVALAASSDEKIKGYASRIGKTFVAGVQSEARTVFSEEIMRDLTKVEALAGRASTALGKIFTNLAPSLGPFIDNLVRSGDAIMHSLVGASGQAAGPLKSLGNLIENTSNSIARFITLMAKDSRDGADGLDFLSSTITSVIDNAANFIHFLDMIHNGLSELAGPFKAARNWMEDHTHWLDLTADGYKEGSEAADLYRRGIIGVNGSATDYTHYLAGAVDSTGHLKDAHDDAATAADKQKKAEQELTAQLKAQVDPAFGLLAAIDGVHDAQKAAADSAKKYGSRSEEARAATRKLAEAAITLQGAAKGAGGAIDGKMTPSLMTTLRAAGLTKGQIAGVARELERAKARADAYDGTYQAIIKTTFITETKKVSDNREMNHFRAAGGPIVRGVPYIVGENGPEIVVPDDSGRVLSASASRGLMVQAGLKGAQGTLNAASSGGGSWDGTLRVAGNADSKLASLINYLIRTGMVTT